MGYGWAGQSLKELHTSQDPFHCDVPSLHLHHTFSHSHMRGQGRGMDGEPGLCLRWLRAALAGLVALLDHGMRCVCPARSLLFCTRCRAQRELGTQGMCSLLFLSEPPGCDVKLHHHTCPSCCLCHQHPLRWSCCTAWQPTTSLFLCQRKVSSLGRGSFVLLMFISVSFNGVLACF